MSDVDSWPEDRRARPEEQRAHPATPAAYGFGIGGGHPFTYRLGTTAESPELFFAVVDDPPLPPGWDATPATYESEERTVGARGGRVIVLPECSVLSFGGEADFFVWPDRILCHLLDPDYAFAVEIWLFGTVLTFWLEQHGMPVLHAASVEVDERSVGFLATSQGGKSSLAATFMQAGHRMLGDDLVPVEHSDGRFLGRPAYPQMRMWPEQARYFLGTTDGLVRVQPSVPKLRVPVGAPGFGAFCPCSRPLAALYLPERHEGRGLEIAIERIPFGDALIELVRHSFLGVVVEVTALQRQRFHVFGRMLRDVPVLRLRYPSGMEHLPRVRDAVLADLTARS